MGRMHAPGKGISQSAIPYRRGTPTWQKLTKSDVEVKILDLARHGYSASKIGVLLRDEYGVAQVKLITGKKIQWIMRKHGMASAIPEDLYHLIKKAIAIRKHLERSRKDKDSKYRLNLVESKIHRIARYYKRMGRLQPTWKYDSSTASALVS